MNSHPVDPMPNPQEEIPVTNRKTGTSTYIWLGVLVLVALGIVVLFFGMIYGSTSNDDTTMTEHPDGCTVTQTYSKSAVPNSNNYRGEVFFVDTQECGSFKTTADVAYQVKPGEKYHLNLDNKGVGNSVAYEAIPVGK